MKRSDAYTEELRAADAEMRAIREADFEYRKQRALKLMRDGELTLQEIGRQLRMSHGYLRKLREGLS